MSGNNSRSSPTMVNCNFASLENVRTQAMSRCNIADTRSRPKCQAVIDTNASESFCGETKTLSITDELKELYEKRLKQLNEGIGVPVNTDQLQLKVEVLQSWLQDILEQNAELVHTVEELEREMVYRVKLLEEKLIVSAGACREYMSKVHEFNGDLQDVATDKDELERKDTLIDKLQAEIRSLKQHSYDDDREGEITRLREHLQLKDSQIQAFIQRIQQLREDNKNKSSSAPRMFSRTTADASTMTGDGTGFLQPLSSDKCCEAETDSWRDKTFSSHPEVLHRKYEMQQVEMLTIARQNDILAKQLEEVEICLELALRDKEHLTDEVDGLHKQLADQNIEVMNLAKLLSDSEKVSRDMQSALTVEVANKHDIIMMLRQDNFVLQEDCRHINMQTCFKDDIIKELRKDLKQTRSKISILEQELLEMSYKTDINLRLSSSPQRGLRSPVHIQSVSKAANEYHSSTDHGHGLPAVASASNLYQVKSFSGKVVYSKSTQCDLPIKTTKPRSRGFRVYRHSIADCSPSVRQNCGDASLNLASLSTDAGHRRLSPPSKDIHRPENDVHSQAFSSPMDEAAENEETICFQKETPSDLEGNLSIPNPLSPNNNEKLQQEDRQIKEVKEGMNMIQLQVEEKPTRAPMFGTNRNGSQENEEKDRLIEKTDLQLAEMRQSTDRKSVANPDLATKLYEKDQEIETLEAEVMSLRSNMKNCMVELHEKDNKIEELKFELNSVQNNLRNCYLELSKLKELQAVQETANLEGKNQQETYLIRMLEEKTEKLLASEEEAARLHNVQENVMKEINHLKLDIRERDDRSEMESCSADQTYTSLKQHIANKNRHIENQEEETNLLRNTVNSYKGEVDDLKRALQDAEERFPYLQRQLETSKAGLMNKDEAVKTLQQLLNTTQEEFHKLNSEIKRLVQEQSTSQMTIRGLETELNKARGEGQLSKDLLTKLDDQQRDNDTYLQQCDKFQEELNRANAEIQLLQSTLQTKDKMLADKEQMEAIQKDSIKRWQDEFNTLQEKLEKEKKLKASQEDLQKQIKNQQVTIGNLQQALLSTKHQLEELQGRGSFDLHIRDRAIEILYDDLIELEAQYKQCFDEAVKQDLQLERLRDAVVDLNAQKCRLIQDAGGLETQLLNNRRELESSKEQMETAKRALADSEKEKDNLKDTILNLSKTLEQMEDIQLEKRQLQVELDKAKTKSNLVEKLRNEVNHLCQDKEMLQNQLAKYSYAVREMALAQEALKERVNFMKDENNDLQSEVGNLKDMLRDSQTRANNVKNTNERVLTQVKENEQTIAILMEDINKCTHELELRNVQLDAKQKEADDVRRMLESMQVSQGVIESLARKMEIEMVALRKDYDQLQDELDKMSFKKQAQDAQNEKLTALLKDVQAKAEMAQMNYEQATASAEEAKAAFVVAASREAQLREEFANIERDIVCQLEREKLDAQQLSNDMCSLNREVDNIQSELSHKENQLLETVAKLQSSDHTVERLQANILATSEALQKVKEKEMYYKQDRKEKITALDELMTENSQLKEQLSNLQRCYDQEQANCAAQMSSLLEESVKLKLDLTKLIHLHNKNQVEQLALSEHICKLNLATGDNQQEFLLIKQELNKPPITQKSFVSALSLLEEKNIKLKSELTFMHDAFKDLLNNSSYKSQSIMDLQCQLSEANVDHKNELNGLCVESRCLINIVKHWINQQVVDTANLSQRLKTKTVENHKLTTNLKNLLTRNKALQEDNSQLHNALAWPQATPPVPQSFSHWPERVIVLPSATTVHVTRYHRQ